jgi:hypothetical protein
VSCKLGCFLRIQKLDQDRKLDQSNTEGHSEHRSALEQQLLLGWVGSHPVPKVENLHSVNWHMAHSADWTEHKK